MDTLKLLLTSVSGLLSLGIILFMIAMGVYLYCHMRKLMNQQPGKEGWD